ncbi:hypothetical protein CASFOL_034205 [Castilleja foliolosa]|uniref:Uncharacterized protein n=1 Tax=Castilleja foliolosa TaxID=1961234 RepID=A0ABD3BXQ9_9LAMI
MSYSSGHNLCRPLLIFTGLAMIYYYTFIILPNQNPTSSFSSPLKTTKPHFSTPTNLSHLAFVLLGSEKAWHKRKSYIESWWRPNSTRGLLYLDVGPTGDLLPWSPASPPYRVSQNLTDFVHRTKARSPVIIRLVHGIKEALAELDDHENLRWLVMGDDDSVFLVDNIVDVLAGYDHNQYYYIGGQSEFIMSNHWFSFNQGFGGAGFMLSYPLAKALAKDMENCLTRHGGLIGADTITMACVADVGVNLSPHKGIHQIDLRGDISGFLSSHPKSPLLSLHHFDKVDPIFPTMDRFESTRHLMKAAAVDQSRMLQQTICYHRPSNWSFSISWGYSAHIYEKIMTRSYLQKPIETFRTWSSTPRARPHYMFNTRLPSNGSCEAPHVFFFERVNKSATGIVTTYSRAAARGLPTCWDDGHSADLVSEIRVLSQVTKRKEVQLISHLK